jgi:ubiquinone/menaquinone biosynthesis C-methylase UbiE
MRERFWDLFSKNYDRITQDTNFTRNAQIQRFQKYLNSNQLVLDYGCGTGAVAVEIANRVKLIQAIDISKGMLAVARQKALRRGRANVEFSEQSLFNAVFRPESFDIVLAMNVLHFLEDAAKSIRRIYELLRPGGYFISSTECGGENRKSFVNSVTHFLSLTRILPDVRFFKRAELDSSVGNCGFELIECDDYYNLRQPNHFIVAQKMKDN